MPRAFKFLRRRGNEKPAGISGGSREPEGSVSSKKDETNMTAVPLFNKSRVTPTQQLSEWIRQGKAEVFTVIVHVTPDIARLLLASNDNNRNVNWTGMTRSVAAYSAAMKRGEWVINGESIIVSRDGKLNDGQHRLHAVIQAQTTVPMQMTFGVDRDTRHTVDQGIARSPGQILLMAGEMNTNTLAGALQYVWALEGGLSLNSRFSTDQMLETLKRYPELREAVKAVRHLSSHYKLSTGYIAGAHFQCRKYQPFSADQYLEALTTGLNIKNVNSPISRLRRQFEDHRAGLKTGKLERITQAALYIKGFNNFTKGKTGPLSWRSAGPTAEAFPKVGG